MYLFRVWVNSHVKNGKNIIKTIENISFRKKFHIVGRKQRDKFETKTIKIK